MPPPLFSLTNSAQFIHRNAKTYIIAIFSLAPISRLNSYRIWNASPTRVLEPDVLEPDHPASARAEFDPRVGQDCGLAVE